MQKQDKPSRIHRTNWKKTLSTQKWNETNWQQLKGKAVNFVIFFGSSFPAKPWYHLISNTPSVETLRPRTKDGQSAPVLDGWEGKGRLTKPCKTTFSGGLPLKIASVPVCLANCAKFCLSYQEEETFHSIVTRDGTNNGRVGKNQPSWSSTKANKTAATTRSAIVRDQREWNERSDGGLYRCTPTHRNPPVTPLPW